MIAHADWIVFWLLHTISTARAGQLGCRRRRTGTQRVFNLTLLIQILVDDGDLEQTSTLVAGPSLLLD